MTRIRAGGGRRRTSVAMLALVLAAGCTDSDAGDQVIGDAAATTATTVATTTSTTTSTAVPSTTAATTTSAAPTPTTAPFDGATDEVRRERPATTTEVVAHTGLEVTADDRTERITFRFDGALPGVVVRYVERPVRASGSGEEVEVAGGAVLAITFEPASSARLDGEEVVRTYGGPDRVAGTGGTVDELVRTGDFEALYEWVAGVSSRVPFRVEVDDAAATVTIVVPAG